MRTREQKIEAVVGAICGWIDTWENRCLATDGDVPKTLEYAGEEGRDELDRLLGLLYRARQVIS